jgi:hypothetical protein
MTDSQNPYELLPDAELPKAENIPNPLQGIEPTGTFLVMPSGVTLPDRCVYTNEPTTSEDIVSETLTWGGKSFRPSLGVRRCEIRYSVSSRIRQQRKLRKRFLISLILLCLALGLWLQSWLMGILLVLLVQGLDNFLSRGTRPSPPLHITDFRDGRFWVNGCCIQFLLQYREELGL